MSVKAYRGFHAGDKVTVVQSFRSHPDYPSGTVVNIPLSAVGKVEAIMENRSRRSSADDTRYLVGSFSWKDVGGVTKTCRAGFRWTQVKRLDD